MLLPELNSYSENIHYSCLSTNQYLICEYYLKKSKSQVKLREKNYIENFL